MDRRLMTRDAAQETTDRSRRERRSSQTKDPKLMEKRAHGVLRGKIGRIKESNVDPAWLAGKLLAAGIIGDSDVEKASNDRELSTNRLGELVRTVMRNGAPGVFQTFVQILLDRVDVKWLGEELKGRALFINISALARWGDSYTVPSYCRKVH